MDFVIDIQTYTLDVKVLHETRKYLLVVLPFSYFIIRSVLYSFTWTSLVMLICVSGAASKELPVVLSMLYLGRACKTNDVTRYFLGLSPPKPTTKLIY
jgi:hypothetical protein